MRAGSSSRRTGRPTRSACLRQDRTRRFASSTSAEDPMASPTTRAGTRWTVFDPGPELFYVNIAQPAEIVVVDPRQPDKIARSFSVPHAGPHGLDLDGAT